MIKLERMKLFYSSHTMILEKYYLQKKFYFKSQIDLFLNTLSIIQLHRLESKLEFGQF